MAYIVAVSHENYLKGGIKCDTYEEALNKWKEEPWRNIHDEEGNLVFPIANQFPIGRHDAKIEITHDTGIFKADNLTQPLMDKMTKEEIVLQEGVEIEGNIFFGHNIIAFPYADNGLCYINKKYAKVV